MPSYLDLLPDELHLLVMKHVFDKCISHLKSMTIQPVRYVPHHPNTVGTPIRIVSTLGSTAYHTNVATISDTEASPPTAKTCTRMALE